MLVFDKVLVANRGEIAVRVVRACRDLGINSVVVHSQADAGSLAVRMADEAVLLEGETAAETYLDVDKIVAVARRTGAQAVHPGYGFLSENAALADALATAGLAFVGPSAAAIDAMGSKISARKIAAAAGVPTVPGVADAVRSAEEVERFAAEHGFPVAIKASFGGGGRGMRVVHEGDPAADALEAAQREAKAYFGRSEVYLERYLERPRHVEIQVLADTRGSVVWVGDRDCSVQRRHQKVIEEAPASVLDEALRARMGDAAVAIAREVGYVNAGTLEFLVEDGRFYFLEMNTRLQVEHPVTELVSGIDLVREQLRIAAGEPLSVGQEEISGRARGHAIEIRINAEDPTGGRWTPSPGPLNRFDPPGGYGVRLDTGYEAGDVVSGNYDGLIAKLVVWAEDRPSAVARACRAIAETRIEGVATSLPAQLLILRHSDFTTDQHYTRWLEDASRLAELLPAIPAEASEGSPEELEDRSVVTVGGRRFWIPPVAQSEVATRPANAGPPKALKGQQARAASGAHGDGQVRSPMQGTVVQVLVEPGQAIGPADVVCVVEAMKMENPVTAAVAGRVEEILVEVGANVPPGSVLAVIAPTEDVE
ncbi:ATP-binding protein [Nocardia vaccinii]|uniref:ATP-binding protein n=1 Tax=Nocardia vaccinii TaxID=1822 RepID=UPI0027D82FBD|nr:biotin carboxylase N-terminal domain-containing protein [Nocardia vaccinii]